MDARRDPAARAHLVPPALGATWRPVAAFVLLLFAPVLARGLNAAVIEPKTGTAFAETQDGMTLAGVGVRTKTLVKVKVYAIALYVDDSALAGLQAKEGQELYDAIIWGDHPKQVTLKFVRQLSASQIQGGFVEALGDAHPARRDTFVHYFAGLKDGDEATFGWGRGGVLLTTVAGQAKPPIEDKEFAAAIFGIWLGPAPIQEDVKRSLVSRLPR